MVVVVKFWLYGWKHRRKSWCRYQFWLGSTANLKLVWITWLVASCIRVCSFPRLMYQMITGWGLETAERYSGVLAARSQKSRCQQGSAPSQGSREILFCASSSFWWLEVVASHSKLCLQGHIPPSHHCPFLSVSLWGHLVLDLGPTQIIQGDRLISERLT